MAKKTKEEKKKEEEKIKKYREITADDITSRKEVRDRGKKISTRDHKIKMYRFALVICILFLIVIYFLLWLWRMNGGFVIGLNEDFSKDYGIVLFESMEDINNNNRYSLQLNAGQVDYVTNICINWIKVNPDTQKDGSHNGDNYFAYTFYLRNMGTSVCNYHYTIYIDDVVKNVDEAVRIIVYRNGEPKLYAKPGYNGNPERQENSIPVTNFFDKDRVCLENRDGFKPKDIDKFTIVIFIEGDDPQCLNPLIGGEMKMHMEFNAERIDSDKSPNFRLSNEI